jgi:ATP-binding cassette, subfamily B, bacterial MsbA
MKIYLRILNYVKKYKLYLSLSIFFSILFSIFSALSIYLTIPLLKTLFLDESAPVEEQSSTGFAKYFNEFRNSFEGFIFEGGIESALIKVCLLIIAAFFLKNLTGFVQSIYMQKVEKGVLRDIRNKLYEKINSLSLRYFTTERSGNLISRMTNDVNVIQSGISATFSNMIRDPLLILIFVFMALSISWQMTLIALVVFPVTVIVISKIGASLRRRSMRVQRKSSDLLSIITETIYGAKVIRSFRAEKYLDNTFKKESDEYYRLILKNVKASELASPVSEFLTIIAGVCIIWFGGREILINNTLAPEEFFGFLFIIFQLVGPIKNLGTVNNRIQESAASGERIFEILDQHVEIKEADNAIVKNTFDNEIEFRNVSFYYEKGKNILEDINLTINRSEIIAVVGPSGVGKSTFADLAARFYDPTSGNIYIDGIDLKLISMDSLRNLIGIVPQETILFNDTIKNNIIFGMSGVTEEILIDVCKSANAYKFILNTEKGFDTIVGERGLKLSGGQRQRLAIARAILRNPQILILDEATSSLDTESEKLVQDAIDKLMQNRTSIVIAHRLSTVKNADRIIVFEKGKISQTGKHRDLIQDENGIYKKLYELQFD